MASGKALSDGIYTKLTADQSAGTLYAAVSGRIYHGVAPDDAALPLLVFNVIDNPVAYTFTQDNLQAQVQFDIYVDREAGAASGQTIDDKLFTLIQRQNITVSGYTGCNVICLQRGVPVVEDDAYRIRSEYRIFGNETV